MLRCRRKLKHVQLRYVSLVVGCFLEGLKSIHLHIYQKGLSFITQTYSKLKGSLLIVPFELAGYSLPSVRVCGGPITTMTRRMRRISCKTMKSEILCYFSLFEVRDRFNLWGRRKGDPNLLSSNIFKKGLSQLNQSGSQARCSLYERQGTAVTKLLLSERQQETDGRSSTNLE